MHLVRCLAVTLFPFPYQGDAPAAPPLAIPSAYSSTTPEPGDSKPRDSQLNHIEPDKLDSESDEDDLSIPPGVILVTTPIDDLSRREGTPSEGTNITGIKPSSNQGTCNQKIRRVPYASRSAS